MSQLIELSNSRLHVCDKILSSAIEDDNNNNVVGGLSPDRPRQRHPDHIEDDTSGSLYI